MARSTGVMTRTTNGTATSACAIGHQPPRAARRSSGGRSSVMRNPKPTVTADDAERQHDTSVSRPAPAATDASANAAQPPTTTAITVAATAKRSELAIASTGATNSVLPAWTSPSAR